MNAKFPPVVPNSLSIEEALRQSAPLALLRQRIQDSNARFAAIRHLLPGALSVHLKAGPVDDSGWTVLASNAAVAAKLRQLQPRLEDVLRTQGWQISAVRIKVQPHSGKQT